MPMSNPGSSQLVFRRFGRSYHVRIRNADELQRAVDLDEALWVATDAPASSFACDEVFLSWLDADGNGRIIFEELRRAVRWTLHVLNDWSDLSAGRESLRLYAVDASDPDGHRIVTSARKMLRRLGETAGEVITLQQVREIKAQMQARPISEAGVVLPSATDDPAIRDMLADIVACTGGAEHPSGEAGVDVNALDTFLTQTRAAVEWFSRADVADGEGTNSVMPLGEATAAAWEPYNALHDKLEQFFAQCEVLRYDPALAEQIALADKRLDTETFNDPQQIEAFLREAPLAPPTAEAILRYETPNNPQYIQLLRQFDRQVVEPILGGPHETLSWPEWDHIKQVMAAHAQWQADRPAEAYRAIGPKRLSDYLEEDRIERIRRLCAESADTAFEMGNIRLVEKLLVHQANLLAFANSYISFPTLYDPSQMALFERGTLVIDGRRLTLAVDVPDRAEHIMQAEASRMFVVYIEARRGEERREFCLPVTDGGRGNIVVGKRGVFIDRDGREYDARIVHIIDNPVSLGEGLAAPFKRIGRLISGKIDSLTAEAEQKLDATTTSALDAHRQPAAAPATPNKGGFLAGGLLMGGGVAIAALASSVAYMTETFSGIESKLDILIGLGVILGVAVLLVVVPTLISAKVRLRRRDLSAILEGSGWAVNARMRLTRRQSRTFTRRPPFPAGAAGVVSRWKIILAVILLVAFVLGVGAFLRYGKHSPLRPEEVKPAPVSDNTPVGASPSP